MCSSLCDRVAACQPSAVAACSQGSCNAASIWFRRAVSCSMPCTLNVWPPPAAAGMAGAQPACHSAASSAPSVCCADHVCLCDKACRYGRRSAWRTMHTLGRSARAASLSSRIQWRWVLAGLPGIAQLLCAGCSHCKQSVGRRARPHAGGPHPSAAGTLLCFTCLAAQRPLPLTACISSCAPMQVTRILAELRMDYESLVAGGCCRCRSLPSTLPLAVARWLCCCCCQLLSLLHTALDCKCSGPPPRLACTR